LHCLARLRKIASGLRQARLEQFTRKENSHLHKVPSQLITESVPQLKHPRNALLRLRQMVALVGDLRQAKLCRKLVDWVLLRSREQLAVVLFRLVQPSLLVTDFAQHQGGSMEAMARNREGLQKLPPLERQSPRLFRPSCQELARG